MAPMFDEDWMAAAEAGTPERVPTGWYCPHCAAETPHILCDGCKTLICETCGYPCACGGDGDDYFDLKAENDFAAGIPERED
jgi:hypothetical protein